MSSVNADRIPNNVHLADDKRLQRALEAWQPSFLRWWREMGPAGFQDDLVYPPHRDRASTPTAGRISTT